MAKYSEIRLTNTTTNKLGTVAAGYAAVNCYKLSNSDNIYIRAGIGADAVIVDGKWNGIFISGNPTRTNKNERFAERLNDADVKPIF